jgi:hypothetical protein
MGIKGRQQSLLLWGILVAPRLEWVKDRQVLPTHTPCVAENLNLE